MAEIKIEPITFEDLHGREFTIFDEDHSHSDIVRYLVDDIGYDDVRQILDIMEEEDGLFDDHVGSDASGMDSGGGSSAADTD